MRQGLIQAMEMPNHPGDATEEASETPVINAEAPEAIVSNGDSILNTIEASRAAAETLRRLNALKTGDEIELIHVVQQFAWDKDTPYSYENLFTRLSGRILDKVMLDNLNAEPLGKEFIFLVEGEGFLASVVHSSSQPELRNQPELFKEGFYVLEKRNIKRGMNAIPRSVLLKKIWGKLNKNASRL